MKFCPECGTKLPLQGAKFCPECGSALQILVQSPDPSPASVDPTSREGVDLYNAGLEAGRQGNHVEAARCFRPLAESGDPQSAEAYAYSLGMLSRHEDALPWLERAAQAGLFSAASRLAADAADKGEAFRARLIFAITAEAGDVVGQAMLANLCIQDRDYDCAKKWWTRIVADNNPEFQQIVDESRDNLDYMQQDPGYIAHTIGNRRGS